MRYRDLRGVLASSVAVMAVAVATPAVAQVRTFNVPAQAAATGIPALAKQADIQLLVASDAVSGKTIRAVKGRMTVDEAIRRVMDDASLRVVNSDGRTYTLAPREMKKVSSGLVAPVALAMQDSRAPQYDEIIVTAQKKAERIIDVPIAMSAFSAEALDDLKIESGSELLRAIPNVAFSKSNFASYNFSIRGIGTKALAASTDPAVAISFNGVPLIRNRLFEQEYFDVERVEVLRGPQGTLYGRNATGGVVNMITMKPRLDELEASLKVETGNYESRRLNGYINLPLGSQLSLRAAASLTKRDGYDFNLGTDRRVNDRDLWSTRISARWEPVPQVRINAAWEHFSEDDMRSRTGKQLCTRDEGPTRLGSTDISSNLRLRGIMSQGCLPSSIYSDKAYNTTNAFALPHVNAAAIISSLGFKGFGGPVMRLIEAGVDPYEGVEVSRNLREIDTVIDPKFNAKNDVVSLSLDLDLSERLTISSLSSYSKDYYNSFQDYNRVNSNDVFNDSSKATPNLPFFPPFATSGISPGGILTDPQLGPSSKILAADQVLSNSHQWFTELRVNSYGNDFFNFNIGANYLKFKISEDYFVFSNLFTALAKTPLGTGGQGSVVRDCAGWTGLNDCTYIDPNPIGSLNRRGHNYFLSQNIGLTQSYSVYGEAYFNVNENVKLTLGGRFTDDKKISSPIETQLLTGTGLFGFGLINEGFYNSPDIVQRWKRFTGRAVIDWRPDVDFSSDLLLYGSYANGYKGGGANPPGIGADPAKLTFFPFEKTFRPETVNAFEAGLKGEFAKGRLLVNASSFLYSYKDYQVSQIVDRIALNESFDATIWGAELEAMWRPSPRFTLNGNLGLLKTRIGKGMKSVDVMNRTQGNDDWVILKPWIQLASNCIAPRALVEKYFMHPLSGGQNAEFSAFCGGQVGKDFSSGSLWSNRFGIVYDPSTDAPNNGRGFDDDLGGNELPNAPNWTLNIGAEYKFPARKWMISPRIDFYVQGNSWARVYNTEIDKLKSWSNTNISLSAYNEDIDLRIQIYVKNVFNDTPITDLFINSDDSGLTANVFTLDPRIFGISLSKKF